MKFKYIVDEEAVIKSFLIKKEFSLTIINKLLTEKTNIFINGKVYNGNYKLKTKDSIEIILEEKTNVKPINKEIDIVFEDELFLVVNKPKGLVTIPSKRHFEDSLAGRVANYFIGKNIGIHIINRLDINTCGLIVFAKSQYIQSIMAKEKIEKKYYAKVYGILNEKEGIIDKKIDRESKGSVKRIISENGKRAITKYKVILEENDSSLLDIELLTGRTHQIRVHMSNISHPLIGDTLYNEYCDSDKDFYLCAYSIKFKCRYNNKEYCFKIK